MVPLRLTGLTTVQPTLKISALVPRTSNYRSKALSRGQVASALAAYQHAQGIGHPLNLSLDIHWAFTRFARGGIWSRRPAVISMLESQRHWLTYHGVNFCCILVREAPPSSSEGEHAHQLVHVPAHLHAAFIQHTRDFLRGRSRHQAQALRWAVPYNDGKLAYILKGSTAAGRALLAATLSSAQIEKTEAKRNQGIIYGKRLLISQALGPKAQREAAGDEARGLSLVRVLRLAA